MLNKTIALAFSIAVTLGFAQTVTAGTVADAPATIIIYRADESVKTKSMSMKIFGDSSSVGKLKANKVVVTESPAGAYTLGSSIPGTEALTLDLKPGATYYVHAKVEMGRNRVNVELSQVTEQVARVQQPSLEGAI